MLKEIIEGWGSYALDIDCGVSEKKVFNRAKICAACPLITKMQIRIFTDNKFKNIEGYKCAKCKCPISPKIRSNDICPVGKWQ